jgi:flagellar hook-associated protein FlgK
VTEEEYMRMRNLLDAVVEQQATFAENQIKADARMGRHEQAIASLLTLAELHEQEISQNNSVMTEQFKRTDDRISTLFKETDERINALVDVVERYITKG